MREKKYQLIWLIWRERQTALQKVLPPFGAADSKWCLPQEKGRSRHWPGSSIKALDSLLFCFLQRLLQGLCSLSSPSFPSHFTPSSFHTFTVLLFSLPSEHIGKVPAHRKDLADVCHWHPTILRTSLSPLFTYPAAQDIKITRWVVICLCVK